jgi:hypothetical protein
MMGGIGRELEPHFNLEILTNTILIPIIEFVTSYLSKNGRSFVKIRQTKILKFSKVIYYFLDIIFPPDIARRHSRPDKIGKNPKQGTSAYACCEQATPFQFGIFIEIIKPRVCVIDRKWTNGYLAHTIQIVISLDAIT